MSLTHHEELDKSELDKTLSGLQLGVIRDEDGPMLEAVDAAMAGRDLMAMRPLVLATDLGALSVRRVMKRLEVGSAAATQSAA